MFAVTIARAKCYIILQGLELSLGETLIRYFDYTSKAFLTTDEQTKALGRLREDLDNQNWTTEDVRPNDLFHYLDLGDLAQLLNRHVKSMRNANPKDVTAATNLIKERGIISIRKRVMHPIRPLEPDDLIQLLEIAKQLPGIAPTLIWGNLIESWKMVCDNEEIPEITIPKFWREEASTNHNLPFAEFDDTGFIGRHEERRKLKQLLSTSQQVITIVGEGGKGKTALALRTCNDLLEERNQQFERIVWVSLKTKYLTPEGIKQINNAVDSVGALVEVIFKSSATEDQDDSKSKWSRVLEQMKTVKTLLVIDNLETIGNEIRDLLLNIPTGSKVLMTSRIGLGEIEVRYELPELAHKDATQLFRVLTVIYNYAPLQKISQDLVDEYCRKLGHNPLLIKWFVLTVGKGGDPSQLLSKQGTEQALNFCYSNIYEKLSPLAKTILSILLAARRQLTKGQLQELTMSEHVNFTKARQELLCSSMVNGSIGEDGTESFQISGLVYEYLSNNFPPGNSLVIRIRDKMRKWQLEQDRNDSDRSTFRYGTSTLVIETIDQQISAQHLRKAIQHISADDFASSHTELDRAKQLTPSWWEVYLVEANMLEKQFRPIYEIEQAYETSIKCKSNDINLYHYANYLVHQNEFDRALEKIETALGYADCLQPLLRNLKGLALMWGGHPFEAIPEFEFAWKDNSQLYPVFIKKTQGTLLAEAFRRRSEQLFLLGREPDGLEFIIKSVNSIDQVVKQYSLDRQIVDTILNIVFTFSPHKHHIEQKQPIQEEFRAFTDKYDKNIDFINLALGMPQTIKYFEMAYDLRVWLPTTYLAIQKTQLMKYFSGTIRMINAEENFGFVQSVEMGDVHFGPKSLTDVNMWSSIKVGDLVSFRVIRDNRNKSPHATTMQILGSSSTPSPHN